MARAYVVAVVAAILIVPGLAVTAWPQAMAVYDDFESGSIDPARWRRYVGNVGESSYTPHRIVFPDAPHEGWMTLEFRRAVEDGALRLALRTRSGRYGRDPDYRHGALGRLGLRFNDPALASRRGSLRRLQATVAIMH